MCMCMCAEDRCIAVSVQKARKQEETSCIHGVSPIMKRPRGGSAHLWRRLYVQRNVASSSAHLCLLCAIACHGSKPSVFASHTRWMGSSHRLAVGNRAPRPRRCLARSLLLHRSPRTLRRYAASRQLRILEIQRSGSRDAKRAMWPAYRHQLARRAWSHRGDFATRWTCSLHLAVRRR